VEGGRALAERVRIAVRQLQIDRPEPIPTITVSIGVCEYDPGMDRADLLECADRALYRAKAEGRDRVAAWTGASARAEGAGRQTGG